MNIPFGEINMRDHEHVQWVKSQRDPELWHAAAMTIVNTLGDPHRFLVWVAEQPELDRATAGYIFLPYGASYLRGQTDFSGGEGMSGEEWLDALRAICRRGAASGFTNDAVGLPAIVESTRQECLGIMDRGEVVQGIPVPRTIVATPFPPARRLPFVVEDGTVLNQ